MSAGAQKVWKTAGPGDIQPQYLPNSKNKFQVKFVFTWSIIVLLSIGKKTKTILWKVFKIKAFKVWQGTTKGTLRP